MERINRKDGKIKRVDTDWNFGVAPEVRSSCHAHRWDNISRWADVYLSCRASRSVRPSDEMHQRAQLLRACGAVQVGQSSCRWVGAFLGGSKTRGQDGQGKKLYSVHHGGPLKHDDFVRAKRDTIIWICSAMFSKCCVLSKSTVTKCGAQALHLEAWTSRVRCFSLLAWWDV